MPRHFAREVERRRLRRAVRAWWLTSSPAVLLTVPGAPASHAELDALYGDDRRDAGARLQVAAGR